MDAFPAVAIHHLRPPTLGKAQQVPDGSTQKLVGASWGHNFPPLEHLGLSVVTKFILSLPGNVGITVAAFLSSEFQNFVGLAIVEKYCRSPNNYGGTLPSCTGVQQIKGERRFRRSCCLFWLSSKCIMDG